MTEPSAPRGPWVAIAAIAALALVLRTVGLGSQPLIGDDGGVGYSALNFVERGWPGPTMWNHPRLRDLLVWLSLDVLGHGPWGLKLWSVLLGTASVAAAGALAFAVSRSTLAAGAAALLVAVDPLHVDFSRQAINDVYTGFFPVAAVVALLRYRARPAPGWLVAAGVLAGLGVASKWNAAFPVAAAAAVVLAARVREGATARARAVEVSFFAATLVLLPLAVYLLTFAPWFGRGHDLAEWLRLQRAMGFETATHAGYVGTKLPGFPGEVVSALRWFATPVWYVDIVPPADGAGPLDLAFVTGVPNVLACLAVLPAAALALARWARERDAAAGWLLGLFLVAWLPFVLVPRPVWVNSAVGVLPWAYALVGWAVARLHADHRAAVRAWGVAALAFAALLWLPAMGVSTRPTDGVVHALVPPAAFSKFDLGRSP